MWPPSIPLNPKRGGSGLLKMGEGVRELDETSDGEGVMDPSSDPRMDA